MGEPKNRHMDAGQVWQQHKGLVFLYTKRLYTAHQARARALGIELEDAFQSGYFALCNALEGYDPAAGAGFGTYLQYHVRHEFYTLLGLRTASGRGDPMAQAARFEEPLPGQEDITLGDAVPDPVAAQALADVEQDIYTRQLHAFLEKRLDSLKPNQAAVLRGRYFRGQSADDLAGQLGVSRVRVYQLEKEGLRTLARQCSAYAQYVERKAAAAYHGTGFAAWQHNGSVEERLAEWPPAPKYGA